MNKVTYNVSGMMNTECKTQIKNALDKIKGIQNVGVDLKAGTVAVEFNEPADERRIIGCIEKTGFTVTH